MIFANKASTFINIWFILNLHNVIRQLFYKRYNAIIGFKIKQKLCSLLQSKVVSVWLGHPYPVLSFPKLSFKSGDLDIKHVSFWNGVKSSLERDFWYFFAGIKPLWLFAWSSYWLWVPSTLLQCPETKPNTDVTMENVSPENTEEDLTLNFDPFAFY